jgi:hypothetical protein
METLSQTLQVLISTYTGIYLAGGGSMLLGLDKNFSKNRLTSLWLKIFEAGAQRHR